MRKVKNRPAVKNLAVKNYQNSKKRNRTAITAIALTTMLFTILFTLGIGMVESVQYNNMRMSGGCSHATLKYLSEKQYEAVRDHPMIKELGKNVVAGIVADDSLMKRPVELNYSTETGAKMNFAELHEGRMPKGADEIVLDTITLDMLGLPYRLGGKAELDVDFGDRVEKVTFMISGYYKGDPAFVSSLGYVSEAFVEKYLSGRGQDYYKSYDSMGTVRADLMFKNSRHMEDDVKQVIEDSGFVPQDDSHEMEENTIAYGINWAYVSANVNQDTISSLLMLIPAALLILITGYLIIYNVFQISVIRDIRFYGLLKTIGTTGKQIRHIFIRQAMSMCLRGIPIGLAAGFLTGKLLLPVIMTAMLVENSKLSLNPLIFLGSAVFAVLTVIVSSRKPVRIASKVSPVEAVKYNGVSTRSPKKLKKSSNGAKLWRMAFSNLGRNRKRTVTAVISMSLSLVLMNGVYQIISSFDMDKFVERFISVDYQSAHSRYFNNKYNNNTPLSRQMIEAIEAQPGFEAGGGIYTLAGNGIINTFRAKYQGTIQEKDGRKTEVSENEGLNAAVFGMDAFCLENLKILKGSLDLEKLNSGKGILLGVEPDDYGSVDLSNLIYDVGDNIILRPVTDAHEDKAIKNENGEVVDYNYTYVFGDEKEYEVLGIYEIDFTNSDRHYGSDVTAVMTAAELESYGLPINTMTYLCDGKDDEMSVEQMEHFFDTYTSQTEPTMKYMSKVSYQGQYRQLQMMVVIVGFTMCGIVGIIGILNFINSITTSIIARKQEFAVLKSIGMTGRQMKTMLCLEGVYYGVMSLVLSSAASLLFSYGVLVHIDDMLWFCTFRANFLPVILAGILLILLGVLIPLFSYRRERGSVVEQLRDVE